MNEYCFLGNKIPKKYTGKLESSNQLINNSESLKKKLAHDGYLLFRNVLDNKEIYSARYEVFQRLYAVGEIKEPIIDGIPTGVSKREEMHPNLIDFWRSVCEGEKLRKVTHGSKLKGLMGQIFDEEARPQDYFWLRPRPKGWATEFHFDHPFFARGEKSAHIAWIPLGDIAIEDGPLTIVENPHLYADIKDEIHSKDGEANKSAYIAKSLAFDGEWSKDIVCFLKKRNTRLLTTNFRMGDLLVFSMDTLHGALDNCSSSDRVRLSCDIRVQPYSSPLDNRFFGKNPKGIFGNGYGSHKSHKPLVNML